MKKIPKTMQGILWSSPVNKLDLEKDKVYIIHQVLMYGDLDDIYWLFKSYSNKEIEKVFLEKPQKVYTRQALNFISEYVLGIKYSELSQDKYVSAIY